MSRVNPTAAKKNGECRRCEAFYKKGEVIGFDNSSRDCICWDCAKKVNDFDERGPEIVEALNKKIAELEAALKRETVTPVESCPSPEAVQEAPAPVAVDSFRDGDEFPF